MVNFNRTVKAHDGCVTAMAANDAAVPSTLVTGDATGEVRVWDAFTMTSTVQVPTVQPASNRPLCACVCVCTCVCI